MKRSLGEVESLVLIEVHAREVARAPVRTGEGQASVRAATNRLHPFDMAVSPCVRR
jgi:hypothetical protein